jgi:hypothetical protein
LLGVLQLAALRQFMPPACNIATMQALIASGRQGQAAMTADKF